MLGAKTRAAGTAPKNNHQSESCQIDERLSSLKLQIGGLLLFGNTERMELWGLFEILLMQFIELKYPGGRHYETRT